MSRISAFDGWISWLSPNLIVARQPSALVCAVATVFAVWIAFPSRLLPAQPASLASGDEMVQLNFTDDIDLKAVVDFVSGQLELNILYDEQVMAKKLTIKAPKQIHVKSLLGLLQSALQMKDLALADTETADFKRIVQTSKLPQVAPLADPQATDARDSYAITQVFLLENADAAQVDASLKPFLTQPGANSLPLPELKTLIVTDYAANMLKIARLVELADQPQPPVFKRFIQLEHIRAAEFVQQVNRLITGQSGASGQTRPAVDKNRSRLSSDSRTNQLIVEGTQEGISEIEELVRALDVSLEMSTEVYRMRYVEAQRIDDLMNTLTDSELTADRYKSAIDEGANLLIVKATPVIHRQIRELKELLDVTEAKQPSPIQFHKLRHVTALELLDTLRSIEQDVTPGSSRGRRRRDSRIRGVRDNDFSPGNFAPAFPGDSVLPPPPNFNVRGQDPEPGDQSLVTPSLSGEDLIRLPMGEARITADESTNTLIVVGDPTAQRGYADLIEALDKRRPQVMIEARLVILDAQDDFTLGVEVSGGDREGLKRLFAFTSFGLSAVDPITGALEIIPGTGLNGTLVDPEVADAVLRALTKHERARILSAPRLLVNDNATGLLTSVQEEPFTSINALNVGTTTQSFAGFAEAGTTIDVTPHISDENYLQLEYRVILNTFTGTGGDGVPPPRQTNELESEVTIPDGHTVIVGGLRLENKSLDVDSIPFLEKIPIVKHLVSLQSHSESTTSLFIFLRPTILREDKFRDLKFLSERDLERAKLPGNFPSSVPVLIKPVGTQREENGRRDSPIGPEPFGVGGPVEAWVEDGESWADEMAYPASGLRAVPPMPESWQVEEEFVLPMEAVGEPLR